MGKKRDAAELGEALERAAAVEKESNAIRDEAMAALTRLWFELDSSTPRWHEARELLARDSERQRQTIARRVGPCPSCGGGALLVSRTASFAGHGGLGIYITRTTSHSATFPLRLVVCQACGDIRLVSEAPDALLGQRVGPFAAFGTVTVPTDDAGPYR